MDPEFFEAFPTDGLVRRLARLDMSADEVPAVGIPPTRWVAMRQEHETIAYKCRDGDRSLGDHDGTVDANAPHATNSVRCGQGMVVLVHPMQDEQMASTYEYRALELREKYTGGRLSGEKLEKVLNEHASQGWQLKFLTRAGGGGLNNLRIFLTFEREIG